MTRLAIHPGVGRNEAFGDERPRQMIATEQSDRIRLMGDSDNLMPSNVLCRAGRVR